MKKIIALIMSLILLQGGLMATNTTNYGLVKPDVTEYYSVATSNSNLDAIDAQMKANADAYTLGLLNMAKVFINVTAPPSPLVAAVGDGVTDDTAAIQACLDYAYNAGGGTVYVPEGFFITSTGLRVRDNVTFLGGGYGSHIRNIATNSYNKIVVMTGNIGDILHNNGLYAETTYNVNAINSGDINITFANSTDASNFSVGDIITVQSYETWPEAYPENTPKYINLNVIKSINSGVLTLERAIPDDYSATTGNPKISKMSGDVISFDGDPLWMAKNACIKNLRLTQVTGGTSGWYCIFSDGINCRYEDLWMDDCSSLFGTNASAHSTYKNIFGRFEGGALDLCDFQIDVKLNNVNAVRFATNTNPNIQIIGMSIHSGTDAVMENCRIDMGGNGAVITSHMHRVVFDKCNFFNSDGGTVGTALYTGSGYDVKIMNTTIKGSTKNGISLMGERHMVDKCTIQDINRSGVSTNSSIFIAAGVNEYTITNNVCGKEGERTVHDRIHQNTAFSPKALVKDNITYYTQPTVIDSNYVTTNSTTFTTLKSYDIKGGSVIQAREFEIFAAGIKSGTAGAKTVQLKLGSKVIATVNYAASDTGVWTIEATIQNVNNDTQARIFTKSTLGTTIQAVTQTAEPGAFSSNTTLTLEAKVDNSGDVAAVYQWNINPTVTNE